MRETSLPRSRRLLLAVCLGAAVLAVASGDRAGAAPAATGPTWSVLSPPAPGPALRGAAAAYDAANGTVVVFGGLQANGTLSDHTWVWDGTTWTMAKPSPYGVSPPARMDASMAYNAALNQLILFGGEGPGGVLLDDTWEWNGESWVQVQAPTTPGARAGAALATDARGRLVLFGGYGTSNAATPGPPPTTTTTTTTTTVPASSTTSTSTSSSTTPASSTTTSSSTGGAASGISPPQTAAANPSSTTAAPSQTARSQGTTAGQRSRRHSTAPSLLNDTWVLESTAEGDNWASVDTPVHPPASLGASFVSEGGRTILFGGTTSKLALTTHTPVPGSSLLAGTWNWNGGSWQLLRPAGAPPARAAAVAVDDTALGSLVLFGGDGPRGPLNDVWALTGTRWRRLATSPAPAARYGAIGVYDAASRQLVLLGGAGPTGRPIGGTVVLTATPPVSVPSGTSGTSGTPGTGVAARHGGHGNTGSGSTSVAGGSPPVSVAPINVTPRVHPGDVITLSGHGFAPRARIRITFGSDHRLVAVTTANGSGAFRVDVTVPDMGSIGPHDFEAIGAGPHGPVHLVTPVRVAAFTTSTGPSPATSLGLVVIALAVPALTLLVMSATRRRRQRAGPAVPRP